MCAVSMITDYGQRIWPQPWEPSKPWVPTNPPMPPSPYAPQPEQPEKLPSPEDWKKFMELVKAAEKFDRETGQPDCVDPEKDAWMKRIMDRLDAIEKKIDAK